MDLKMTKNLPAMILLMGEVGAGKSTFINTAAGKTLTEVGDDLDPCTSTVKHFTIQHHGREVVLVDTPGFNHPTKADGDILKKIVDWLKNECPENIQFGGIVYLHDLSQSSRPRQMATQTKLPDRKPSRITLALVDARNRTCQHESRGESQLKNTIWRELQTCDFLNTQDSAWIILDTILNVEPVKLQCIWVELDRICKMPPTQFAPKSICSFFASLIGFKLGRRWMTLLSSISS